MAKITLNTITSSFASTSLFNTNFSDIETELNDKVLYRNNPGGEANQMENDLDMNSNDILNCDDLTATTITLNGTPISPTPVTVTALAVTYDNTTSGLTASNVQAALDERVVDFDAHIVDAVDAHDASSISNVASGNLVATEVQAALNELQTELDTTVTGLSDHLADTVDSHDASAISNIASGNLAATEVQAALNELQTDIDNRLFNDQADTMNGNLTITSTLLDLDNSAAATSAKINVRNSEGGINLFTDGGISSLNTTDSAGANIENSVVMRRDAATELYFDNAKKFETTSAGVFVTGGFDMSNASAGSNFLNVRNTEGGLKVLTDAGSTFLQTLDSGGSNGENAIAFARDGQTELYHNDVKKFETSSIGTKTTSGTALTQNVMIDTTGGADIVATAGNVEIRTTDTAGGTTRKVLRGVRSAETILYHNDIKKLETTSTGVKVTGNLEIDSKTINFDSLHARNLIINGDFSVWQRGTTHSTEGYGSVDRWNLLLSGATGSLTQQTHTFGQTDVPGNPTFFARIDVTGANDNARIETRVEGAATGASQVVMLSFYAKSAGTIPTTFQALIGQDFGTGGSPSSDTSQISSSFTLTSSWQRFTYTVTIPSVSGKTLGSDGNDFLRVQLNNLTNETWEADVSNVQLEFGDTATDFEFVTPATQLARCKRYFERFRADDDLDFSQGQAISTTGTIHSLKYEVEKRAIPTITFSNATTGWSSKSATNGAIAITSITTNPHLQATEFFTTTAGSLVAGNCSSLIANGSDETIDIDAEL